MKFRPRYWSALLWHWATPFMFGGVFAYFVMVWQFTALVPQLETAFTSAISAYCGVSK